MYPFPSEKLSFETFLAEEKTLPLRWDFKMEYYFALVKLFYTLQGETRNSDVTARTARTTPGQLRGRVPNCDPEKTSVWYEHGILLQISSAIFIPIIYPSSSFDIFHSIQG